MTKTVVIADDFTGANGTAAAFSKAGLSAIKTWGDDLLSAPDGFDVVVACTDSRHLPSEKAAQITREVAENMWPADLFCNRIDTTFRGNVGSSTESLRRTVERLSNTRTVTIMAPAWPSAGRATIEGHQLLNGLRLEMTEVGNDIRSPIRRSDILGILSEQAEVKAAHIPISVITKEDNSVRDAIKNRLSEGANTLILDAFMDSHLEMGIRGVIDASLQLGEPLRFVTSDPEPASVIMAKELGLTANNDIKSIVVVSASATAITRNQLATLQSERVSQIVLTPKEDDGITPSISECAQLLSKMIEDRQNTQIVGIATCLSANDLQPNMSIELQDEIPNNLAVALRMVLEKHEVGGLYVTGGDACSAVLKELDATGYKIEEELEPLCVGGVLTGGRYNGLPVVTKGGLIGDSFAGVRIVDYLLSKKPS